MMSKKFQVFQIPSPARRYKEVVFLLSAFHREKSTARGLQTAFQECDNRDSLAT